MSSIWEPPSDWNSIGGRERARISCHEHRTKLISTVFDCYCSKPKISKCGVENRDALIANLKCYFPTGHSIAHQVKPFQFHWIKLESNAETSPGRNPGCLASPLGCVPWKGGHCRQDLGVSLWEWGWGWIDPQFAQGSVSKTSLWGTFYTFRWNIFQLIWMNSLERIPKQWRHEEVTVEKVSSC